MSRSNIEIYDHQFNFIFNDSIDTPDIDEDYLSPAESSITLGKIIDVPTNGLIYFDYPYYFLGLITAVDQKDYYTEISFMPFITIFNQSVLFDTNLQGQKQGRALEENISDLIYQYWVNSSDNTQNLSYLSTNVMSLTYNWGMNLKSDTENMHHCIINFYDVLISTALTKYGIVLNPVVDRTNKKVIVQIKTTPNTFYLNADMSNVTVNSFVVNDLGSVTNKLEIWNSKNYTESVNYYLHPDGSYDRSNTNRIEPVKLSVLSVEPNDDTTFVEAAQEQANSEFSDVEPINNIELEVLFSDTLIEPMNLEYGQVINIIHEGNTYAATLTGRKFSSFVTLIFGKARLDLTKKIKMQVNYDNYSDKFINSRSATDTRTGIDSSSILDVSSIPNATIDDICE